MQKYIELFLESNSLTSRLLALLGLLGVWVVILVFSGAYQSGLHFMDDDVILTLTAQFESGKDILEVMMSSIKGDFNIRFRPFYWVEHVTLTYLFRDQWSYWAWHHFFIATFTSYILFFIFHKLRYSVIISFCCVVLVLVGYQTEAYWRTSPAERTAMLMFVLSIFTWLYLSRKKAGQLLAVIFLMCATLCKENFILTIPFLLVGILFQEEKKLTPQNVLAFLYRHKILIAFTLIWATFSLVIIIFFVGTNQIGYAGVKPMGVRTLLFHIFGAAEFLNLRGLIHQIATSATDIKALSLPALLAFIFVLASIVQYQGKSLKKVSLLQPLTLLSNNYIRLLTLSVLLYLPQYALYIRNSFDNRYYLPAVFAFSLIILFCYSKLHTLKSKLSLLLLTLVITVQTLSFTLQEAVNYAKEGKALSKILEMLEDEVNKQPEGRKKLLFVFNPLKNQTIFTVNRYFKLKHPNVEIALLPVSFDAMDRFTEKVEVFKTLYRNDGITLIKSYQLSDYELIYTQVDLTRYFKAIDGEVFLTPKSYNKLKENDVGQIFKGTSTNSL